MQDLNIVAEIRLVLDGSHLRNTKLRILPALVLWPPKNLLIGPPGAFREPSFAQVYVSGQAVHTCRPFGVSVVLWSAQPKKAIVFRAPVSCSACLPLVAGAHSGLPPCGLRRGGQDLHPGWPGGSASAYAQRAPAPGQTTQREMRRGVPFRATVQGSMLSQPQRQVYSILRPCASVF